jgi:hypothetical protein
MFVLPEGAYPTASKRFIEAVRDYRRKLKLQPEPKEGSREWYASMRGERFYVSSLLQGHFEQPLLYAVLHRTNWRAARPRLFISVGVHRRDGLYLTARSSEHIQALWGFGFREQYVADAGEFRNGFFDLNLLQMPLEYGFTWSFSEEWHAYESRQPQRFRDERHLCVLAVQAKLHHLSLFFNCEMKVRPVEFGPESFVDWRAYRDADNSPDVPVLNSKNWGPTRLTALLMNSGLTFSQVYEFGSQYLAKLEKSARPEVLGQYLSNSHSGTVTQEDVAELLKLGDPAVRAKRWLADLAGDERFSHMKRERYGWLRAFASEADFSEQEALAWILKHHPSTYETYVPPDSSIREILDSHNAKKLSRKALSQLDDGLAARILANRSWVNGVRARHYLERVAQGMRFADFDELVAWAQAKAPKTHRAALDLAEYGVRLANEAKAAASAKRQARKQARTAP